ncbi:MAG: tetratricopeptide repeat protein [Saprospiraceae bacterium]|nr:tetratricopeptide repeat protein [Candidatus Vicinibacter affinis]
MGEDACLEALTIDPNEPDILENYADILLATGRKELAISNYKKSHVGFIKKYSLDRAREILDKFFKLDSNSNETKLYKIDFEQIYNNKNARIKYGLQMLAYDSTKTIYWNSAGDGYREMEDYNKAIYYYNGSLNLDSTQVIVKINRAFCFDELNQSDRAIKDLNEVLALDSTESNALNNLGFIYLNSGSYDKAEPLFLKAISCNPKFANPKKHLGILYYRKGDYKLAKQYLLKAIELEQDYMLAYLGLAYVFTLENNPRQAIAYVEQAIAKGSTLKQLEKDEDPQSLRDLSEWNEVMKKYFPDKF